jgi:hypothetical protein
MASKSFRAFFSLFCIIMAFVFLFFFFFFFCGGKGAGYSLDFAVGSKCICCGVGASVLSL